MRAKQFIAELYDLERKYTGSAPPPPPNPPGRGDGPWEPEPEDNWWRKSFFEFVKTLKYDLSKAGMNILYPRNPNETGPLFDANYNATFKEGNNCIRVLAQPLVYKEDKIVEASVRIMFFEKDESDKISGSKDMGEKKLRGNIKNLEHVEWIISKIKEEVLRIKKNKPLKETTLTEAATDIVYHYMTTSDAVRTLRDNHYSLESSTGLDVEEKMMPSGKHWYLATTRSKVGDYHVQKANDSGVMFVLDGRWLNDRYETKPVDYWSLVPSKLKRGEWQQMQPSSKRSMWQGDPTRGSESEDRVFSKSHAIPLKGSTLAVHAFVIPEERLPSYSDPTRRGYRAAEIKNIIAWGARRNIPVYLYDDKQKWISQREQYRIGPNSEYGRTLLSGAEAKKYIRASYKSDYYNNPQYWIELIEKNPETDQLSKSANTLRYNMQYYPDTYSSFETNIMSNAARNPESEDYPAVIVINQFMSRNRLPNIKTLQEFLKRKWSSYKD